MMGTLLRGQRGSLKRQWAIIPLFATTKEYIKATSDLKQLCHPLPLLVKCSCKRPAEWRELKRGKLTCIWKGITQISFWISTVQRATKSMSGLNAMYLHKSPLNMAGPQIYSLFYEHGLIICSVCACVQDISVFIPGCNHKMVRGRPQEIQFPVCLHYSSRKMNGVCDVYDSQWEDKTVIGIASEARTHTRDSLTTFDCSYTLLLLFSFASSLLHRHSVHLISRPMPPSLTHRCLSC